jgi:hypothetical protein
LFHLANEKISDLHWPGAVHPTARSKEGHAGPLSSTKGGCSQPLSLQRVVAGCLSPAFQESIMETGWMDCEEFAHEEGSSNNIPVGAPNQWLEASRNGGMNARWGTHQQSSATLCNGSQRVAPLCDWH